MKARALAVGFCAVFAVACTAVAVGGEITMSHGSLLVTAAGVALACVGSSWFAVGAYLVMQRPRHRLGWMFLGVGLLTQASVAGEIADRAGWVDWIQSPLAIASDVAVGLAIFLLIGLLPILYPSGQLIGRWARMLAVLTIVGALLAQAQVLRATLDPNYTWPFGPPPGAKQPWWDLWLPWLFFAAGVVGGWTLCVVRLVRARHPERQQLAWLLIAVVAVFVTALLGEEPLAMALQAVALLLLPVAVVVGIARYQLLDIETKVPRVITAGVFAALVAAVYLIVMAVTGVQITGEVLPSVIVAAIAATALLPLHARLRKLIDRFVYGKAADPLRAVTGLGDTVTRDPNGDPLVAMLAEIADTFRAEGARIDDGHGALVAETGRPDAVPAVVVELIVAGEPIGMLGLGPRMHGERYTRAHEEMLRAMASTVALAVRSMALADELEEQRDAVFEASARARARLQHDLHDGLGPSLTGMRLGLQALADRLEDADLVGGRDITAVLRAEVDHAVIEVRRLIDDMRPLELDGADLTTALRRRLATLPGQVPVEVRATGLRSLPVNVEDAVFRVVLEAVANAQKHSGADAIVVTVEVKSQSLVARVEDNGHGWAPHAQPGVGLTSMRSRAARLDGAIEIESSDAGTAVTLRLPVPQPSDSELSRNPAAQELFK